MQSRIWLTILLVAVCGAGGAVASNATPLPGPHLLLVTAHPDDDLAFAGLCYRVRHELDGVCDSLVITNGEGGFKYSTLAEPIYGVRLTDPEVGKRHLPSIRKEEALRAGRLVGFGDLFFLDEPDFGYTTDPQAAFIGGWDVAHVRDRLRSHLTGGGYDFVLTHFPRSDAHGHHQAASLLALEEAAKLGGRRPVVLGTTFGTKSEEPVRPAALAAYPISAPAPSGPWIFDRTRPLGHEGRLSLQIVVNWAIAEHKSQGTMQLLMNRGELEVYWAFAENPPDAPRRVDRLFASLGEATPASEAP